jgi:MFS family permease
MQVNVTSETRTVNSIWAPLQRPVFRVLWWTSVVSAVGLWMQDIAQAWLMTSLAPSPMMVSLVQTATYLPFFLLAIPAGAIADLVDRRVILLTTMLWVFFAVIGLGLLTLSNAMTPWLLIILLFVSGLGSAMNSPAWNSLAPELVPKAELESAVALGGAGFNCARGIGAALGGFLVAQMGAGWVFILNALLMTLMWTAIFRWKREKVTNEVPERVIGAMRAGLRYVRHSKPLRHVLTRTGVFVFCASALWALLPLLARTVMKLDSTQYGLIISAFGIGTLCGAGILPRFRNSVSLDVLAATGTGFFAVGMASMAVFNSFLIACAAMFAAGIGWIFACNSINSAILMASPAWVRARSVAMYLLVFQGCLAFGSLTWGFVAQRLSMHDALVAASCGLLISLTLGFRYKLTAVETLDMRLSGPWPKVEVNITPHPDHGPVLITVEYKINPEQIAEFFEAVGALEKHRRRNGAFQWHLFIDLSTPGVYVESYFMDTWAEHLRQRDRATLDDVSAEEKVYACHIGEAEPKLKHMLSERRRAKPKE